MAQYNKTNFQSLYDSTFADNTTGNISEGDMRQFVTDLLGSLVSNVNDLQLLTTATGTNTYAITAGISAYASGYMAIVKFTNASTGASTLNANSIAAKKIFVNPTTQAGSGDIPANSIALLVYDATLDSAAGGFLMLGLKQPVASTVAFTTWDGVTFPTATGPTLYVVTADHGSIGEAEYVQAGSWMLALTAGVTTFANVYIKP